MKKRNDYILGRASKIVYGTSLGEAVENMQSGWRAGDFQHGQTPIATRKELKRMLKNIDKIGSVMIELLDDL